MTDCNQLSDFKYIQFSVCKFFMWKITYLCIFLDKDNELSVWNLCGTTAKTLIV